MCGINGFISQKSLSSEKLTSWLHELNNLIYHRGPDDDGIFTKTDDSYSLAMGMRRLAIIDLESGKQPIFSNNGQLVIVFNGEIYNYKQLKNNLLKQRTTFETNSDTEVILKGYEKEGTSFFKKLDGMFAFSIYDLKKKKVFIARDFFGEKPLYFSNLNGQFIWGSELKSIVKKTDIVPKIDLTGLNLYFRLTYIPAPYTIYRGIKKLLPNSFITYNLDTHDYSVSPIEKKQLIQNTKKEVRFENAKAKVKDLVYESVALRSVSDVPIGTFLSGGVDSSIVSLCLAQFKSDPINTFSIGFEKKSFDETDKSQTVAKLIGSKHHEFIIGEKDLQKSVGEILLNFDEPFADSSSLPTYLVSQKTRKYVKVALTGDGGDEVFGGYNKYYAGKMNNRYINIVPHTLHKLFFKYGLGLFNTSNDNRGKRYKIKRLLSSIDYGGDYYWDIISLGFAKNSLSQYILPQYLEENVFVEYGKMASISHPSSLTDYRVIDKHISLEGDMLVKVDRTSMLNSLECRAPFLNKRIWEYTNSLPEGFLMNGWKKKHILKEAFRDQFPAGFLDKSKSGFGVPVGDWLKSSLQSELRGYINKKKLEKQGIFQVQPIIDLVSNHMSGKVDNTFKVWTFYCFQKWYYSIFQNL